MIYQTRSLQEGAKICPENGATWPEGQGPEVASCRHPDMTVSSIETVQYKYLLTMQRHTAKKINGADMFW